MPLRSRYPCSQKARVPGLLAAQGHEQANGYGSTVDLPGAGTPYTSADNPASASPDCGHTYTSSNAG